MFWYEMKDLEFKFKAISHTGDILVELVEERKEAAKALYQPHIAPLPH